MTADTPDTRERTKYVPVTTSTNAKTATKAVLANGAMVDRGLLLTVAARRTGIGGRTRSKADMVN